MLIIRVFHFPCLHIPTRVAHFFAFSTYKTFKESCWIIWGTILEKFRCASSMEMHVCPVRDDGPHLHGCFRRAARGFALLVYRRWCFSSLVARKPTITIKFISSPASLSLCNFITPPCRIYTRFANNRSLFDPRTFQIPVAASDSVLVYARLLSLHCYYLKKFHSLGDSPRDKRVGSRRVHALFRNFPGVRNVRHEWTREFKGGAAPSATRTRSPEGVERDYRLSPSDFRALASPTIIIFFFFFFSSESFG